MIPLYQPGASLVHRTPVGWKFLLLFAAALAVSFNRENLWIICSVWVMGLVGYLAAGQGLRGLTAQLWRLKWLMVFLTVPQLIFLTPEETAQNVARVIAVVLLAALFTLTTRTSDVLAAFETALSPLERLGVPTDRISLALSLTIRSIPVIFSFYSEIREAHRARGVRASPRALVMPLLVMSLRHSEEVAESLAARGVR